MYQKSEKLLSSIVGATRADLDPMLEALDILIELHFDQHLPRNRIQVTKSVYPQTGVRVQKSPGAVARSIERLANRCWDKMQQQDRVIELLGRRLYESPAPSELLFYLAYLLYFDQPFFTLMEELSDADRNRKFF